MMRVIRKYLVVGLLLLWLLLLLCRPAMISPAVHAKLLITGVTLQVTNQDHFAWSGVTLYVNGTPFKDAYQYHWDAPVPTGQTITIDLDQLATSGKRFDPKKEKVQMIYLAVPGHELMRISA